jgi:hypothetical protein
MIVLPVPTPLPSNTAGKPRSPSLTRVTTHPVVGPFLGATPAISRLHPDAHPTPNSLPESQLCFRTTRDVPSTTRPAHVRDTQLAMNVSGLSQTSRAMKTGSDHPRKSDHTINRRNIDSHSLLSVVRASRPRHTTTSVAT